MKMNLYCGVKKWIQSILVLVSVLLLTSLAYAQTPLATLGRPSVTPVVDGMIDQVWATAQAHPIVLPFRQEIPTLGMEGETYWKGLWSLEGIYILVKVNDNVFSPPYAGTDPATSWMYDKPELYFDCNYVKKDGQGAANAQGHYCFSPPPVKDQVSSLPMQYNLNGSAFCYKVSGTSYVVEYFIPFKDLLDKDQRVVNKTEPIGFDITIVDNDVKSPMRNRMVWANNGVVDESWNNMDDAGQIVLEANTVPGDTISETDPWSQSNLIKNWDFASDLTHWGGWYDAAVAGQEEPVIDNGTVKMVSGEANNGEFWHYQFNQVGLQAEAGVPYVLKFKSWSSVTRTNKVDFEDLPENGFTRYGASTDAEAINARSEWVYITTTEPQWYTFHVVFDQIKPTTVQKVQWMLSNAIATTYLDSILLMKEKDANNSAYLAVSTSSITMQTAMESNGVFDIKSNATWQISCDQPWVSFIPSTGTGNKRIFFTAQANTLDSKREAIVTVSAAGLSSKTLLIVQPARPQTSRTLTVTAGKLSSMMSAEELSQMTGLTLTGTLDARDFKILRDQMPLLKEVDLGAVTIASYLGTEGTARVGVIQYLANTLPENAFRTPSGLGKNTLTTVILPSSITAIGSEAFTFCNGITSITIPPGVKMIHPYAFSSCSKLTTIHIPASVYSIGAYAFQNCTALTSLTIPSSVTSIGEFAFNNCSAVIRTEDNNPNYSSLNGILYNKSRTSLISCPISKAGKLVIPSSVSAIESSAFGFCSKLSSVTIPASVTSISNYVFSQCTALDTVYALSPVPVNLSSSASVFSGVTSAPAFLFVPTGSKALYSAASQWKDFSMIEELSDLTLSTHSLEMEAGGGNASVQLICDTTWTISNDQGNWLVVWPNNGKGDKVISVTATENTSFNVRKATLTVKAAGQATQFITVIQKVIDQPAGQQGALTYGEKWSDQVWNYQNLIKNWNFTADLTSWDFWVDAAIDAPSFPAVVNGVASMASKKSADGYGWHYQLMQRGLQAEPNVPYVLKFKSWSSVPRSNGVLFEDSGNNYNRYGASEDEQAYNGSADWTYYTTTEPRWYTFHVVFDQMVPTTVQKIQWNLSTADATTYLDSVILVKDEPSVTNANYLILSKEQASLMETVTHVAVDITSNTVWEARSDQPWLTVNPSRGTGNGTITLTAMANTTFMRRSAMVTVYATGVAAKTIAVTQQAKLPVEEEPDDSTVVQDWGSEAWTTYNLIKNWNFNTDLTYWENWLDGSVPGQLPPVWNNGTASMSSTIARDGYNWHYLFMQPGLQAEPNVPYTLRFKSWSNVPRSNGVLFEDSPENSYNRYGASTDAEAINGRAEWTYYTTTRPQWYTFHVVFDQIRPNTIQKLLWMLSSAHAVTYLDSVVLIKDSDLLRIREAQLALSASHLNLGYTETLSRVEVSSNTNSMAISDQDWLMVYPALVTGNKTLAIATEPNPENTSRTATITLYPAGLKSKTITVTQAPVTGVNQLSTEEQISVYPNPTSGKVKLVFGKAPGKEAFLTVTDVTGRVVLKQLIQNKEEKIDLSGNPPGIYFVKTGLKNGKVHRIVLK